MNQDYIEAVKKATIELYSTMMSMDLVAGEIIDDKSVMEEEVVITGNIGLAGSYKGNIAIHFSKVMAIKSISAMLGMEIDELSDDVKDAIGEIANIIAGSVKTELASRGIDFDLSLPTVISGGNYSMFYGDTQQNGIIISFAFESEKMYVEFDIEKGESL